MDDLLYFVVNFLGYYNLSMFATFGEISKCGSLRSNLPKILPCSVSIVYMNACSAESVVNSFFELQCFKVVVPHSMLCGVF